MSSKQSVARQDAVNRGAQSALVPDGKLVTTATAEALSPLWAAVVEILVEASHVHREAA